MSGSSDWFIHHWFEDQIRLIHDGDRNGSVTGVGRLDEADGEGGPSSLTWWHLYCSSIFPCSVFPSWNRNIILTIRPAEERVLKIIFIWLLLMSLQRVLQKHKVLSFSLSASKGSSCQHKHPAKCSLAFFLTAPAFSPCMRLWELAHG